MLRNFFMTFLVIGMSLSAFAQKPLRVEIEPKNRSDDYYITPAGKNGIVVFNETDDKGAQKGERQWSFTLYDVDFKEVWTKTTSIPKGLEFVKFFNDKNALYILLGDHNTGYKGDFAAYFGDFSIINLNFETGKISSVNGKLPYNTTIADFKVLNNNAFFCGKVLPRNGQVMGKMCLLYCTCFIPVCFGAMEFKTPGTITTVDLSNSNAKYQTNSYKGNSSVTSLDIEADKERVSAFVANRESKTLVHGYIHEFDKFGKEINKIKLNPGENEINTGTISSFGNNEKMIIGTYSLPIKDKSFGAKMARATSPTTNSTSQGVYIAKVENGTQKYIKYYSFTDFQNFFGYLSNRAEQRIEKKAKKKKERGSQLQLSYQILVHQLMENNGQYFFVGECYYPEYHTEYYYTTDANGRMVRQSRQVFDGWRYTHAIVATFDKDGKLLWDTTFPIWNILTFNLKERVKVLPQGSSTALVYSYGGYLTSKIVSGNSLTEGRDKTPIDTGNESDVVKNDYSSDIIYWYDNYFVAWGYQKIKNKEEDNVKKKRFVFYFNKISFK